MTTGVLSAELVFALSLLLLGGCSTRDGVRGKEKEICVLVCSLAKPGTRIKMVFIVTSCKL